MGTYIHTYIQKVSFYDIEACLTESWMKLAEPVICFQLGWLEPLVGAVKVNFTTVPFPNIERINPAVFNVGCINKVNWLGIFKIPSLTFGWGSIGFDDQIKRKKDPKAFADNIRYRYFSLKNLIEIVQSISSQFYHNFVRKYSRV